LPTSSTSSYHHTHTTLASTRSEGKYTWRSRHKKWNERNEREKQKMMKNMLLCEHIHISQGTFVLREQADAELGEMMDFKVNHGFRMVNFDGFEIKL
jgi:hypothetical protein